jgi:uncharacterized protein with NAD-binding domain and iron-sulfur cluster
MKRIPFGAGGNAFENLTVATRILLARAGQSEIIWLARTPTTLEDFRVFLIELLTPLGVPKDEVIFFVGRLLAVATSCEERRLREYQKIPWWDFIQAPQMSKAYQAYLGQGPTRSLVAMRAEESSTRTVGVTQLQLFYDLIRPDRLFDRLLSGPTNDVWIDLWVEHLRGLGVDFHFGARVTKIGTTGSRVTTVSINGGAGEASITADYYIAALPGEVMAPLMNDELKRAAPSLANLDYLKTRWMNGIQFFLKDDVPLANGHVIYLDSPWALTSVSQRQFWANVDLSQYGDGGVRGILSVDVSDWEAPGIILGKPAQECGADQIKDEVWAQLKQHLNTGEWRQIDYANLQSWFLDPDITFPIQVRLPMPNPCSSILQVRCNTDRRPRWSWKISLWHRIMCGPIPISLAWRRQTKRPGGR